MTNPPTYTARGPLDLVALAPFLIGFHPADSVVLLTFGAPEPFHARVDLPPVLDEHEQVAHLLLDVVGRHCVPQVALLLYTDDAACARAMAELLLARLDARDITVVDLLRVEEDRFFDALDPADPGTAYDLSVHPFTASRVFAGGVAFRSREELADTLVGADQDAIDAVELAATRYAEHAAGILERGTRPEDWSVEERDWLRRTVRAGLERPLAAHELGRLLVLLHYVPLRDVAWAELSRANARAYVELWRAVLRRVPADFLAPPAALLAFAAWLAGDGALAWCALDRCLEQDPDYSMALELARGLGQGVSPSCWPGIDPAHPRSA